MIDVTLGNLLQALSAVFLVLAWGLVGSVLYVWHSEALQRSAQAQGWPAEVIRQQQAQLQRYDAALKQARGPSSQGSP